MFFVIKVFVKTSIEKVVKIITEEVGAGRAVQPGFRVTLSIYDFPLKKILFVVLLLTATISIISLAFMTDFEYAINAKIDYEEV